MDRLSGIMIDRKFKLGFFPTPLHPLKNLSARYASYSIFIKRDDQTGLAAGGNKTRKLEYLIQGALDEGCDTVITAGAQQSNHCRQTAAACAIAGLQCHLMLGGELPPKYEGNLLLSSMLGAQIHFAGAQRKGENIQGLKKELEDRGRKVSVIPYGGSNLTGALGFVEAVKELKQQLTAKGLHIDYIFFASSSGGTQAGLMLGQALYQLDCQLVPINIDKDETGDLSLEEQVFSLLESGTRLLGIEEKFERSEVPLNRNYDKAGYGIVTTEEQQTIATLAQSEGILLDPVYTGRAFNAMLDCLETQKIKTGSNVLFWHTGGLPALFR